MQQAPHLLTSGLSPWEPGVFALVVYIALTTGLIVGIVALTMLLNPRRERQEKGRAYECGVIPTGHARFRYPTPFWLVAVFFLLFDVEVVYIVSWAISFEQLDWASWGRITFFIGVLFFGLVWIWRKGGLDWGATPKN